MLVTGATGLLGRAVVRHLVESGHDVRAMTHTARPAADVDRMRADLATGEGIEAAVADVAAIVHAATAAHQRLDAGPTETREDVGGPEVLTYREIVDQWASARGRRHRLLPAPVPGRLGRAQRDGTLTTSALPTTKITWREYLAGGGAHE